MVSTTRAHAPDKPAASGQKNVKEETANQSASLVRAMTGPGSGRLKTWNVAVIDAAVAEV